MILDDQLAQIAQRDPTVNYYVSMFRDDHMPYTQMLVRLAIQLAKEKSILEDAAIEREKRRLPAPIVLATEKAIKAGAPTCPNGHILAGNGRCLDKKCEYRTGVKQ